MIPEGFHFLRPAWLFALGPVALLIALALRADRGADAWKRLVDAHLLRHLVADEPGRTRRWPLGALTLGWIAATFALAGPAWERLPQPVSRGQMPAVVVLSLARSMDLGDVTPSRLERARFELAGIAERARGGQLGLIVYTDVPFVAVPLTDDARVVEELIPLLRTDLMPAPGRHLERAIDEAVSLIEGAGSAPGRIVVLADGADAGSAAREAAARARQRGHRVSVVGLGTAANSDVPLDADLLAAVATAGGGHFADTSAPAALASVLQEMNPGAIPLDTSAIAAGGGEDQPEFDTTDAGDAWRDAGIWLIWVPLLLAPLCFRRGWLAGLIFLVATGGAEPAAAAFWSDLWQTRDQQGAHALSAGQAGDAAELFENPEWQAAARYQSGDYEKAAQGWQERGDESSRYNLGNALARGGKLEEAIAAWDEVIEKNPGHADATFNRDLVQKLLDQQKNQEQPQQQGGDGESQDSPQAEQGEGGKPGDKDKQQPDDGQASSSDSASQDGAKSDAKPQSAGSDQAKAGTENEGTDAAEKAEGDKTSPEGAADRKDQPAGEAPEQAAGDKQDTLARNNAGDEPEESAEERARRASEHEAGTAEERAAAQKDHALGTAIDEALRQSSNKPEGEAVAQAPEPIDEAGQNREQRLRQIPTDPSGLLRARIHRHYAERQARLSGGFAR